jgi:transcription termination factor Rho
VSDTLNDGPTATETADQGSAANGNGSGPRRRSAGGLAGKLLPELQQMAGALGITGTARMRKGDLIAAIQERQGGSPRRGGAAAAAAVAKADQPEQRE